MAGEQAHRIEFAPAGSRQHQLDCTLLNGGAQRVPFVHSHTFAIAQSRTTDLWCRVLASDGALVTGVRIAVDASRKIPLMKLARVPQATFLLRAMDAMSLTHFIRETRRAVGNLVLLNMQPYSMDESQLRDAIAVLEQLGFEEEAVPRDYTQTLVMSLAGDEADLSRQLSGSAKRNIGQVEKAGYELRAIEAIEYVPRLNELLQRSTSRTGGRSNDVDFRALIEAAKTDPTSSILLGIFHPARNGVEALVGFAHGVAGTDSAVYSVAGTDRAPDIGRAPLSYGLLWELLKWGQRQRLPWFDFGGITAATDVHNPLHGISEFKRKFGGVDLRVAFDMSLAVSSTQATMLDLAGKLLARVNK